MPDDRELLDTGSSARLLANPLPGTAATDEAVMATEETTERDDILKKKPLGFLFWFAIGFVAVVILSAALANILPLQSPDYQNYSALNQGPSAAHWLGTDDLGRDLLSRLVFGARVSLIVGFFGVVIGLVFGGIAGLVSGYRGGRLDVALNAISFIILAFPAIVAVIAIVTFWGRRLFHITIILGIATIPLMYRVIRASSLSFAQRDFVVAAKTMGATDTRIVLREILPNVVPVTVTFSLITMAGLIVIEGTLAFLGLSVAPPHAVVGQPDQRGHLQRRTEHGPVDHAVAGAGHVPAALVDQPDRRPPAPAVRHPRGPALMALARGRRSRTLEFKDAGTARGRCWSSRTCTRRSAPSGARCGPSTASPSRWRRDGPSGSWASRAPARPCCPGRSWACSRPVTSSAAAPCTSPATTSRPWTTRRCARCGAPSCR